MGRKQAPGKKVHVQCSPEPVRAALSFSPIHNVSSSRSHNDAQRDREVKPLPGNLPYMIILSMLEQLEAKLDNLQSTLEDVPSRVTGLMEKIWIAKGQHHLVNGGASLEMVSPVTVRDCSFSRSPPIPLSVTASELNQCLHPTSPPGREPKHSQCLQPLFSECHEPQQVCTVSRFPPPNVPVIPVEPSLHLQPAIDEEQEPQQDQCTQLEPEDHVKEEPLSEQSWGPQQNFCLQSPYERHEPQQNHCRQRVLTDKKDPHEHIKQELLWIDGEGPQQKQCRQPVFQEEQSPQHNACWQQVFADGSDQHQNCKSELMRPEAQNADQSNKLEPLHPENCHQNYKQEPLHPEDRDENSDLQPTCTDAQGPSVSSSFLAQNTADTDGVIATDPLERGNTESDVLLFKTIPAQQSQTESMNGKENHKASGGRNNFALKINERKHQRIHRSERFNNKTLFVKHKRIHTGLGVYPYAECKKTFTGKTQPLLHEKTHTGLRQYPYTEHETRFADEATLIHHEITHKGERPFHCNICEKSFTQKGNLLQHQRIHTGEKPHHCNVCAKRFSRKATLVRHQIIHTGEKPYHCTVCAKRFTLKATLVRHQTVHTGQRLYHCTVCSKSFDLKTSLVRHQSIHTREGHIAAQDIETTLD